MGLPKYELKQATLELPDGQTIEVRELSRIEVMEIQRLSAADEPDEERIEELWLHYGTGDSLEEVHEWRQGTPALVVEAVLAEINQLTGLAEGSQDLS